MRGERLRLALGAALGAFLITTAVAIALDNQQIAEFALPAAVVAALAVRLGTRS